MWSLPLKLYGSTPRRVEMGIVHIPLDPERKQFNVSGQPHPQATLPLLGIYRTCTRLLCEVQPVFYGPESTGKSTMARRMAGIITRNLCQRVARELVTSNDFRFDDIIRIGNAQTERVFWQKARSANKILFVTPT